ncbi:MAG: hypothetical protein JNM07_13325 [Phycisphaerae bacterium]|nr:hypothetical protein [Phycisphaerae bacterium]
MANTTDPHDHSTSDGPDKEVPFQQSGVSPTREDEGVSRFNVQLRRLEARRVRDANHSVLQEWLTGFMKTGLSAYGANLPENQATAIAEVFGARLKPYDLWEVEQEINRQDAAKAKGVGSSSSSEPASGTNPPSSPPPDPMSGFGIPNAGTARTIADATVLYRDQLRRMADNPQGLGLVFARLLPAVLRQAASLPGITPESFSDLVLVTFTIRPPARLTGALKKLIAHIRGHLELQEPADRRDGYYQTVAALGDFVLMPSTSRDLAGLYYYHEVLSHYWREVKAGRPLSEEGVRRVAVCLFNTLVALADALQYIDPSIPLQALEPFARIAVVRDAAPSDGGDSTRSDWLVQFTPNGQPGKVGPNEMSILQRIARLSNAFGSFKSPDRVVLRVACACVGLGLRRVDRSVPAELFNASVELLKNRAERAAGQSARKLTLARAILNGLGLWAALEISGGSAVRAFLLDSGLSCSVNFLGACSDLNWDGPDREKLTRVVQSILAVRNEVPGDIAGVDFGRIGGSLADLNMERVSAAPKVDLPALSKDLRQVIEVLIGRLETRDAAGPAAATTDWRDWLTLCARDAVREALGAEGFVAAWGKVWGLVGEISAGSGEIARIFLGVYSPYAARTWNDPGKTPLTLLPELKMGQTQWEQWAKELSIPTPSLADAVAALGQPDWWV